MSHVPRTRAVKRKLTEADVAVLAKVFRKIIENEYMPVIIKAVDDRVKEVLTSFYHQAQEANATNEDNSS